MVLLFKVITYITVEAKINNSVEFILKLHQSNINVGITLSVRLIAQLIIIVGKVLEPGIQVNSMTCFTDTRVVLCSIRRLDKHWKPFVQDRVNKVRKLVLIQR